MKKLALIVLMLLSNIVMTFAQDSLVYNITNCPELMRLCLYGPKVIIYAQEGCTDFTGMVATDTCQHMEIQ